MVTEEMLQNTAIALNKIFFATFYCDLNDLTYETMQYTEHTKKMLENITYLPAAFERFIQVLVKSEDVETIRDFCNVDTLAERLKKAPYISCDYDSKLGDGWRQVGFLPAKFDENQNVTHALFVVRSLDENRSRRIEEDKKLFHMIDLQRKAAQLVSSSVILAVALIDKENGSTRITAKNSALTVDKEYSFEEWVQWESSFVVPIDQPQYKREATIENIKEKLKSDNHYTLAFSTIGNDEKYRYIIHHFSNLDDDRFILSVAEDATNWISSDTVTGCINRNGFSKRSQIYIDSVKDNYYAMLCFDVQDFKAINSWYGFENGDKVLKEIGQWLQSSNLNPVLTCRENSDTFFCLVERDKLQLEEIEKLCQTRYCLEQLQIPVLLKCGIYNITDHKEDIHMICDKARLACADSEKQTEYRYCFFVDEMKENYLDHAYILQNYKEAIENGQIEVFYQPIYETKSKTIASAEALVRWRHPEQGLLSPGVFIPTLEQNGQIAELDRFVGDQVWKMQNRRLHENKKMIPVALNISRYDFRRKHSTNELLALIEKNPEMTQYLRLEVTESSFVDITEDGKVFLECMRQMGAKILVDDFGSGYSSLGMLAQFDCDIIKLDMSFSKSIGNNVKAEILISSAIQIIHKLGLQVVAEGVETKEQYEFYLENDCDYIQGYYFSKPIPQSEFEALVDVAICIEIP